MTAWPSSLPAPLLMNYQQTLPDNSIRTAMDIGPAKVRQRTTANTGPLSFSLSLTESELSDLITFYTTTVSGGTLAFDFPDVRTSSTLSCRFTAPPAFAPVEGGSNNTTVALEIMP